MNPSQLGAGIPMLLQEPKKIIITQSRVQMMERTPDWTLTVSRWRGVGNNGHVSAALHAHGLQHTTVMCILSQLHTASTYATAAKLA